MKARMSAGRTGPYHQIQRREIYQEHARRLVRAVTPTPASARPERLEQVRQEQMKNKQNPRYDGTCRRLDPGESAERRLAAGERHVIRFKIPQEGVDHGA